MIKNKEELKRALDANELVFVHYYDPDDEQSKAFEYVVRTLEKTIDPRILMCKIDVKNFEGLDEVRRPPLLRVFYQGQVIFEQIGAFKSIELNVKVLRRGIRSVFERMNIKYRV
ncbi:MAG: thioredoxin [Desulfurococcaceae archaeon]